MSEHNVKVQLPPIPAKRYFTIGEVSELCGVKPHVLRYWEQEFTQLKPVKRRIRELLYEQGFTISGARNRLDGPDEVEIKADTVQMATPSDLSFTPSLFTDSKEFDFTSVKTELLEILNILRPAVAA